MNPRTTVRPELFAFLIATLIAPLRAQPVPAIPEPPVVFYGHVTQASPAPDLSTVSFTLTGNTETLTTATPARMVTIEGASWYMVSIPVETRSTQGAPALTATLGTLALTAANNTYTVTAKLGTTTATLPTGKTTLIYGAPTQGLIDRIDLTLGGETFAQWSQRIFGSLVSQTDDSDGDGRTNYEEYLAGADLLQSNVTEDGTTKTFTDTNPGSATRLFYRISASPTN